MFGRFLKYWLPLIVWMGVIFLASTDLGTTTHSSRIIRPLLLWLFPHISEETLDLVHYCTRKLGHVTEYAFLGVLCWLAFRSLPAFMLNRSLGRQFLIVVGSCCAFAASDEFHQLFVPGREGQIKDVVLDTFGASMGALVVWGFLRWWGRRK